MSAPNMSYGNLLCNKSNKVTEGPNDQQVLLIASGLLQDTWILQSEYMAAI